MTSAGVLLGLSGVSGEATFAMVLIVPVLAFAWVWGRAMWLDWKRGKK